MNRMLKIGGILYIFDIVFDFEPADYKHCIDHFISDFEKVTGPDFTAEIETHIRDEYSTFRWILDEMIQRAGFKIIECRSSDGFTTEYHCVKECDK
ncbi:MAG: hypothetical protein GX640_06665 [Fibrobacter sp.]|nr:hypothetical protein [Fibrobacter sp.]